MRRLPIYFLVDISESMVGDPIEQVQEGIANIIRELKKDPYSLETVYISVVGFAGEAEVITPLQDIISFYPPKIPIGSGTSLSQGLIKIMDCIDRDIVKTTYDRKVTGSLLFFCSQTECLPMTLPKLLKDGTTNTMEKPIQLQYP